MWLRFVTSLDFLLKHVAVVLDGVIRAHRDERAVVGWPLRPVEDGHLIQVKVFHVTSRHSVLVVVVNVSVCEAEAPSNQFAVACLLHEFYTPNIDATAMLGTQKMLEGHVLADEFDQSGNSSDA